MNADIEKVRMAAQIILDTTNKYVVGTLDPDPGGDPDPGNWPMPHEDAVEGENFSGQHKTVPGMDYVNCTFDGRGASYAVDARGDGFNRFFNCEAKQANKGLLGHNFEWYDGAVQDCYSDGFNIDGDNFIIDGALMQRFGTAEGAHADAIQVFRGRGGVIRNNRIIVPGTRDRVSNACIILKSDFGPISDIRIEDNLLDGGLYNIFSRAGNNFGAPTGVTVIGNDFRRYVYGQASGLVIDETTNNITQARKVSPTGEFV